MKYLKLFEEVSMKQQPFYLKNDTLYISNDFAEYITQDVSKHLQDRRDDFFGGVKNNFFGGVKKTYSTTNGNPHIWTSYKERMTNTNIRIRWSKGGFSNAFAMNIYIYRCNTISTESGKFQYYIGGASGSSEMHGKNMIRATRQCNINLIKEFFPIFKHIPYAHKKLQINSFFDVIKNAVSEKPELAKYLTEGDYPKDYENFLIRQQTDLYNL